ncbi:hypothetical protein [Bradyrhizobium sp.]|uniref:hypothetical protein n=1 Tax=Bradyrhizobium sp. TaxID=376 RepID=UPI003C319161
MIRNSKAFGHDPIGAQSFSLATNLERVCAEIVPDQKLERAGDSTWSHRAPGFSALFHGDLQVH